MLKAPVYLYYGPIADLQILNPFNDKNWPDDKLSILDIKARDRSGRLFDVEMQMLPRTDLRERLLFYWAESGANPSVQTYWDAVHYIATSLSVGYANIFPVTQAGKAIGHESQGVWYRGVRVSKPALEKARLETRRGIQKSLDAMDRSIESLKRELQRLKKDESAQGGT